MTDERKYPNSGKQPHRLGRAAFHIAAFEYERSLPPLSFATPPWPEGAQPATAEDEMKARLAATQRNIEADLRASAVEELRDAGAPIPVKGPRPAWIEPAIEPKIELFRAQWRGLESLPSHAAARDVPAYCIVYLCARWEHGSSDKAAEHLNGDAPKNRRPVPKSDDVEYRDSRLTRHHIDRAAKKAKAGLIEQSIRARRLFKTDLLPWIVASWTRRYRVIDRVYDEAKRSPYFPGLTGLPLFEAICARKPFYKVFDAIDPTVPDLTGLIVARLRAAKEA
ncbi:hypothetical protein [Phreatobacter oligotrophus]|uniref:hypothetical protein n=1 Tax=Phreatobacter oligotrophus TaxID=1122261 RepID=UPI0011B207DF|nr:hypothetical protein [Phreatobacter oligotrophus]